MQGGAEELVLVLGALAVVLAVVLVQAIVVQWHECGSQCRSKWLGVQSSRVRILSYSIGLGLRSRLKVGYAGQAKIFS